VAEASARCIVDALTPLISRRDRPTAPRRAFASLFAGETELAAAGAIVAPSARFVRYPLRPDWGVGRVLDESGGQTRVLFSDGRTRKFAELLSFEPVSAEDALSWSTPQQEVPNAPLPRRRVIRSLGDG
jgi:hypothetical protein